MAWKPVKTFGDLDTSAKIRIHHLTRNVPELPSSVCTDLTNYFIQDELVQVNHTYTDGIELATVRSLTSDRNNSVAIQRLEVEVADSTVDSTTEPIIWQQATCLADLLKAQNIRIHYLGKSIPNCQQSGLADYSDTFVQDEEVKLGRCDWGDSKVEVTGTKLHHERYVYVERLEVNIPAPVPAPLDCESIPSVPTKYLRLYNIICNQ